jgi:hypothetical protein
MRKELDEQLVKKYPLLYRNRYADMRETAMCWGFDCDDGWYNLIDTLSYMLSAEYMAKKERYEDIKGYYENGGRWPWKDGKEITPEDVESRRLEMEEAAKRVPVASQVKEKYGTLRFYVDGASEEHRNYIAFAEIMSGNTCEKCGAPGKIRGRGWYYTACDEHTHEEDLIENAEDDIE